LQQDFWVLVALRLNVREDIEKWVMSSHETTVASGLTLSSLCGRQTGGHEKVRNMDLWL